MALFTLCSACADLTGKDQLPLGVRDPASWHTEAGAVAMYREAIQQFEGQYFGNTSNQLNGAHLLALLTAGEMTDELQHAQIGGPPLVYRGSESSFAIDARRVSVDQYGVVFGGADQPYTELHVARARSAQGIAALAKYAPNLSPALRGHLYSIAGFAEILLADLYCSGVPLSTFDFEGDFTYRPGSSTTAIYEHALMLFDSALAISQDSVWVMHLASVGKGRALLNLGRYQEIPDVVRNVPMSFRAQYPIHTTNGTWGGVAGQGRNFYGRTISDREGGNGYPYLTGGDPRTQAMESGVNQYGRPVHYPLAFKGPEQDTTVTFASGVEARLIEAEAELNNGNLGTWLSILNTLRHTYAPMLPDIIDPGPDGWNRVDTLFAERAAWLFLTAHRQGDLRRLVRQYKRMADDVYPTGPYAGAFSEYGAAVALPIPQSEWMNPHFNGCFSREA